VGVLRPVVQPSFPAMLDAGEHFRLSCHIAAQSVGNDRARNVLQTLQ
jgi:hypothetical protein